MLRNPPGSGWFWAHFAGARQRACENQRGEGSSLSANRRVSGPGRTMQTRLPRRVLRFWVLVSRPRAERDVHAPDCAHIASLPDYRQPINPTGRNACAEGGIRLDDGAESTVFSESEQSKNGAGEMVPLYAARIGDLQPGDLVIVECTRGHTVAIPPIGLLHGLRLPATAKVIDPAPRLRCRECDARGQAMFRHRRWHGCQKSAGIDPPGVGIANHAAGRPLVPPLCR